jgi:AAA family ATP:ADP antiporter
MSTEVLIRSRWERFLGLFARVRPGEGRAVLHFMGSGFMVMFSYYMLKTLREPLLLSETSAQTKSYAYAVIALILLFVVPAYGAFCRKLPTREISFWLYGIMLAGQLGFFMLSRSSVDIGFVYYVWVGVFGALMMAQFWAFAADSFNVKTGQRLFPLIMIGTSLGGLLGPAMAGWLLQLLSAQNFILILIAVLALIMCLIRQYSDVVPEQSRSFQPPSGPNSSSVPGSFAQVFGNRYLLLIASLIVLLNWVNTTGEYILADLVIAHAQTLMAEDSSLDKGRIIAGFYGNFFTVVNALSLLLQMFVVSRVITWIGVRGALLILPVIVFVGYGLMAFMPVFSIIRLVKILENSTDYSIMNTARHSLFLPLRAAEKYQARITIDAFFWRFGDLIQALVVYIGIYLLDFETRHFVIMNMFLALVWIALSVQIGRRYVRLKSVVTTSEPPLLLQTLQSYKTTPDKLLDCRLPVNLFYCEPGDILDYSVRPLDGEELPGWLCFDTDCLRFTGMPPGDYQGSTWITLRATNLEGQWAETRLGFIHI